MKSLVCTLKDDNISHILFFEIFSFHAIYDNIYILKNGIDINSSVQKWRFYVMKKIYDNVQYCDNIPNEENCVITYFKI